MTTGSRRQELWRAFLLTDDSREEVLRRQDWIIGSDACRHRLQQQLGRPTPRRRGRPIRTAAESIEDVLRIMLDVFRGHEVA